LQVTPVAKASGTTKKFLEFAKPDARGWTEDVHIDDLNKYYKTTEFTTNNGGSWCRSDAPLLQNYNVSRQKGLVINDQGRKVSKIISVQLQGFKVSDSNRAIRGDIREAIRALKCAILQTASDIQVDHKSPQFETTPHVLRPDSQGLSDFQALCRAANSAKRGHCQTCKNEGKRFDARILGYSVAQWQGGQKFAGNNCVGCYWYDPVEFNARVSEGYKATPTSKPRVQADAPQEGTLATSKPD
jgi:hypothetical protein